MSLILDDWCWCLYFITGRNVCYLSAFDKKILTQRNIYNKNPVELQHMWNWIVLIQNKPISFPKLLRHRAASAEACILAPNKIILCKQISNKRKKMPSVSQCIKNLKMLPTYNSAANRQNLGLDFTVPFSRVCLQIMKNISIIQLQWCWNYVPLRVKLCLFACYWMHLPKFHNNAEKCTANTVLRW